MSREIRIDRCVCYDRTFALGVGDKEVSLVAELDSAFADVVNWTIYAAIIADEAVPDIGEPFSSYPKRTFFDFFRKHDS